MKIIDVVEKVEINSEFKSWRLENPKPYLAHVFMMMEKDNTNMWQVGYYNNETDNNT